MLLGAAVAQAERGAGSLIVLAGPAGIGKSRLLRELGEGARGAGCTVVTGRALDAASLRMPFAALSEALLHARRAYPTMDLGRLGPWAGPLADLFVGGDVLPSSVGVGMSPLVRAEAVLRLVGLLSESAPLVLGLEDLQWADPDTVSMLEFVAQGVRQLRVLCVATVRSDPSSPALEMARRVDAGGVGRCLQLTPLSPERVREMVLACRPDIDDGELGAVVERAGGVPLLVEELLAGPGVPASLADSVRRRLNAISDNDRSVLAGGAVLGHRFDWRLLVAATGLDDASVAGALKRGVSDQLLDFGDDGYYFPHALMRDAVLETVLPHVRAELARGALEAMQTAPAPLVGAERERAADLARQAGLPDRAAELLCTAGRDALRRGALATAVQTLQNAVGLARDDSLRRDVLGGLVEALAQAGRLEECITAGSELLAMQSRGAPSESVHTHLALARAAIEATRWPLARGHLTATLELLPAAGPEVTAQWQVLSAEVAFAAGDLDAAESLAREVLESPGAPDARCHAFTLVGRCHRTADLAAARAAFADALTCAEMADLPLWRLRATHELGTIELFDHAGVGDLLRARDIAVQLGALSTSTVVDIQLAAAYLFRFDPDRALESARAASTMAEALRADQLRATALLFIAEAHSLRRDTTAMEHHNALALAAAPGNAEIAGSTWGARAVAAILAGRHDEAEQALEHAESLLVTLPNSGPAIYRGLWPLLLAARADQRATAAITAARARGIEVNRANRGLLSLAEATIAGRVGDRARAGILIDAAAAHLGPFPVWSDLAWLLVAGAAAGTASDAGLHRMADAAAVFDRHDFPELAGLCRDLIARPVAPPLSHLGVTPRELQILSLVAQGLSNRSIATHLTVSPRTVEKHVESLLRKTGTTSRTQLVTTASTLSGRGHGDANT